MLETTPNQNHHSRTLHTKYILILRMSTTLKSYTRIGFGSSTLKFYPLLAFPYMIEIEHALVRYNPTSSGSAKPISVAIAFMLETLSNGSSSIYLMQKSCSLCTEGANPAITQIVYGKQKNQV